MKLALILGGQSLTVPSGIPSGGLSYFQQVLRNGLMLLITIGAFLLVIYLVWAGIQWITSGGDKAKVTAARSKITWAIVGFIIILSSFFILDAIGYLFKVNLLKLT